MGLIGIILAATYTVNEAFVALQRNIKFWAQKHQFPVFAGSLEAAYSLNWGAREIWGKGGGETLALL